MCIRDRLKQWRNLTRVRWRDWRWALGPIMVVLPLLLWLVPMLFAVKLAGDPVYDAYARELLVRQTAQRYAASWHHAQPFWYFLPVIALLWIPASLALPWAIPAWRRRLARRHDARILLPLAWAVLVVVFFSLSPGKREVYILPALPMFVVALAPLLPGLLRLRGFRGLLWGTTAALSAALAGLSLYALFGTPEFAARLEAERGIAPWWLTLTIGVAGLAAAIAARPRRAAFAWLGFTAALWLLYGFWGYPMLDAARSGRAVMVRAGEIIGPDAELGLVAWKEQNLLHADRTVADFGFTQPPERQREAALRWLAEAPERRWLFIQDDALGRCLARERAQRVGVSNRRSWYLVRHDAVVPRCTDDGTKPAAASDDAPPADPA